MMVVVPSSKKGYLRSIIARLETNSLGMRVLPLLGYSERVAEEPLDKDDLTERFADRDQKRDLDRERDLDGKRDQDSIYSSTDTLRVGSSIFMLEAFEWMQGLQCSRFC
jgi:hypothetical protein